MQYRYKDIHVLGQHIDLCYMLIHLIISVSLISLVFLVAPSVYGQTCDSSQSSEGKIWTIATGHDWGAYEYL